jgi:hypothetical protein
MDKASGNLHYQGYKKGDVAGNDDVAIHVHKQEYGKAGKLGKTNEERPVKRDVPERKQYDERVE